MEDEIKVEETTTSPSEEIKPTDAVPAAEVKEEKTVPYDRFKAVIEEKNKYKELLATQPPVQSQPQPKAPTEDNYEDALRIVDNRIEEKVSRKLNEVNRRLDLDRAVNNHPDFYNFSEAIKIKIQENPSMNFEDAYKLAKFDHIQLEAQEKGKQIAYQKIEEKRTAAVESTAKANPPTPRGNETIDPMARGADGKFLFSTKELEDILPKK